MVRQVYGPPLTCQPTERVTRKGSVGPHIGWSFGTVHAWTKPRACVVPVAEGYRSCMSTDGRAGSGARVAVITGASAGVGRATSRALARRGWSLGLLARGQKGLDATLAETERLGVPATAVSTDVGDAAAVEAAAETVERELGPIDAWVNNAMTSIFGPFAEIPLEDVRRVTEVNYLGYVHGTRAALDRMLPRDRGLIVQVGSALAFRGIPLQSAYCAAKHAIRGFDDAIRAELHHEHSNVRICEVHLPAVNTPQFRWVRSLLDREARPVPPIYQPEVAAEAIAWVLDHPRRSTWVGPSTVAAILAGAIAPGLLDRYLAIAGYRSQQTEQPADRMRPDNLYAPVETDAGAHGPFDARARERTLQVWLARRRPALVAAASVGAALAVVVGARGRREAA
jgi:NADP-dependent 3-hydroxy acid dehydrogenase YdfG